ncbi:MAG: PAS domain S-box protein [Ginsengibacter sp.]
MGFFENSEEDFTSFFEHTPDLVCIASANGYFKNINQAVVEKLGFTKEELLSKPIFVNLHPEDREATRKTREEMINGKPLVNFENRYITKTGEIIWLQWTSVYMPQKEAVFAIAKDVTEQKKVAIDLDIKYQEFKKIALRFKSSIEKDRQHFAVELHEELAQLAAVIKLNLNSVTNSLPDLPQEKSDKIKYAAYLSEMMIKTIRKISFEISPYTLNYDYLQEALKILCDNFSKLNQITCTLETDFQEDDLTKEIKLDFFRICQEALKNVINHAQAKNVVISIKEKQDKITLTIFDDGKGIDISEKMYKSGLSVIRDRVMTINGKLRISSKANEGTVIHITVSQEKK